MQTLGRWNQLTVSKQVDFGYYLTSGEFGDILLPNKHAPDALSAGEQINVFVYLDSQDRPIATTQKPKIEVGHFAFLKVVDRSHVGAFLDWGLDKDLLVPFSEQHKRFEVGRSYLVHLYQNAKDGRLVASSKIDRFIDEDAPCTLKKNEKVDLIIANTTELGFKAIVNHQHWGVLYQNEVFEHLRFGQRKTGFIKKVREDGKIDLTLHHREKNDRNLDIVLKHLEKGNGFLPLHDKSNPEHIKATLGMSKAAFKKAIGQLYKQRKVDLEDQGIRLIKD